MIPYITSTSISLGPIIIQTWGLFVSLGFLAGATASAWIAKKRGLQPAIVWDILGWIIIGSMIGGRFFHVVFYEPAYYLSNPFEILAIWHGGMSMMGGLVGATLVIFGYFKYKKLDWLKYVDVLAFGLPLGYFIGRIGCFLIHDHPGKKTSFFLGVLYPDGLVRHDLGLYHSLFGLLLFLVFLFLSKKKVRTGFFLVVFLCSYGLFRFVFDFLRVDETSLLFLTIGQWFGIMLILFGGLLFKKHKQKKSLLI